MRRRLCELGGTVVAQSPNIVFTQGPLFFSGISWSGTLFRGGGRFADGDSGTPRHTLALCLTGDPLVQFPVIRHLSVPLGTGIVKTFC